MYLMEEKSVKLCVKNGKTGAETLQMLRTAFSDDCLSQAVVYQWVKQFKEGRESLKDNPRPGRPSTSALKLFGTSSHPFNNCIY
jgi:transposase